MSIYFYDTRRRRKVLFEPATPGEVRLYTCGPTVYNDAHIGNFRTYMFEDLLRRTLKFFGYRVKQVMNLTDVDDKTIRGSTSGGVSLKAYTAPFIERFFADLDALKIERAEVYPAATDHIPEMIAMIEDLIAKGYAYVAEGNVYYSIERFAGYGQLSGMNPERLARGVRIDADEYEDKENFRDFALWKGWSEADGDVWWESPWGRGRPGWHIECSAMSMKYLGRTFDIHTGGVDNIFPHHENEIAQSVAATGEEFARYWLHSAHLQVEGEKMSKSLGNFFTVRELLDQGYSTRIIRYLLISTHYRQRLNFSKDALAAAAGALERLDTLYELARAASGDGPVRPALQQELEKARAAYAGGLADDLNVSTAFAALFDLVSAVHRLAHATSLNRAEGVLIGGYWQDFDRVLGILTPESAGLPEEVVQEALKRLTLRNARDFAGADRIRNELAERGYTLEDGPGRTTVLWPGGRRIIEIER